MPELPEVETIRRSLEPHLVGALVAAVTAKPVRLRLGIRPAEWRRGIIGARLDRLARRGKYLLADFGAVSAVFHLGMSGRLALASPAAPIAPHTHLRVLFEKGLELRYIDPRRFGVAVVLPAAAIPSFAPLAQLGVDGLDGDVATALAAAAARSRAPIRSLLLDQRVIAGLGNIYATEALARAGIHPLRRASSLSPARLARLAAAISAVLADALAAGGTTLADEGFADAFGEAGYFAVRLRAYGRAGQLCSSCGAAIRRGVSSGRSFFYCPRCQR